MSATRGDLDEVEVQESPVAGRPHVENESFLMRLFNSDFDIDFVGRRKLWYAFSALIIVISILALALKGLNLGIEFRGGSVFTTTVASVTETTTTEVTDAVQATGISELGTSTTVVGSSTVRVQTRSLTTDEVAAVQQAIAQQTSNSADAVAYQLIGPSWGQQITSKGIQALVIFLVLVALLIGLYFRNWMMSVSALVALAHDLIVTLGVYALVGFAFTPASLIGVLTILGYSLYDTVVVFDKVRENAKDLHRSDHTYSQVANLAVNQMLVRSINTTIIGVLPVLAILVAGVTVLGGQGALADLGLVMLVGMVAGAYSSIFLATPMLAGLKERDPAMVAHREAIAKRAARSRPRVETIITETSTPRNAADIEVTTAPVPRTTPTTPLDTAAEAGRPQPKRRPRSQRRN